MSGDNLIRRAREEDLARIAEIEVFNYRLSFYPIFRNDDFYFGELQVPALMARFRPQMDTLWVYDDGVVKGFMQVQAHQVKKLFVEPALQGRSIGSALLRHAVEALDADHLWALEKNGRAIAFYARHGFLPTGERQLEEDTEEYLVKLCREA